MASGKRNRERRNMENRNREIERVKKDKRNERKEKREGSRGGSPKNESAHTSDMMTKKEKLSIQYFTH